MATLPTPEQIAREILSIFVTHFKSRPGDVLRINNFMAVWNDSGLNGDDFKPGIDFAAQQEWVQVLSNGSSRILNSTYSPGLPG